MNHREGASGQSAPGPHREPGDLADRFALGVTGLLRFFADTFFAKRYGHRSIVLETVAAVPGMVGALAPTCNACGAWRTTAAGSAR